MKLPTKRELDQAWFSDKSHGLDWTAWMHENLCRYVAQAEREALEVAEKLADSLRLLANDHEFGATGTVRQVHLRQARAALALLPPQAPATTEQPAKLPIEEKPDSMQEWAEILRDDFEARDRLLSGLVDWHHKRISGLETRLDKLEDQESWTRRPSSSPARESEPRNLYRVEDIIRAEARGRERGIREAAKWMRGRLAFDDVVKEMESALLSTPAARVEP